MTKIEVLKLTKNWARPLWSFYLFIIIYKIAFCLSIRPSVSLSNHPPPPKKKQKKKGNRAEREEKDRKGQENQERAIWPIFFERGAQTFTDQSATNVFFYWRLPLVDASAKNASFFLRAPLSTYLSIHISIYLSFYLSLYLSVCLPIYQSNY